MTPEAGPPHVSDAALRKRLIAAVAERVMAHTEELTALEFGHRRRRPRAQYEARF